MTDCHSVPMGSPSDLLLVLGGAASVEEVFIGVEQQGTSHLFTDNNEAGLDMCGQRCRAAIPHGHRKARTFIGAVRVGGLTKPIVLDGPLNQAAF